MDESITLRESIPHNVEESEGIFRVVASNIIRREIDGVTALRTKIWIFPPAGVVMDDGFENPTRYADGDELVIGSNAYRLEIHEQQRTVTAVPVQDASPSHGDR